MNAWALLVTVVLLLGNAFFVGAEFAAMAARRSQLEPLAEAGSARARVCLEALGHMGSMLAMGQLGITICSVLLGAISEVALHHALVPLATAVGMPVGLADVAALVGALLIVVYLHVVLGEMIPKNIAIAGPERTAVVLVPVLYRLTRWLRPVIAAFEHVAKAVVQAMGVEPRDEIAAEYTAEEMAHIIDESHREGLVGTEHYARMGAALEFSDKDAADVAVGLRSLVTVTTETTPAQIERLVAKHGFSRFPVVDSTGVPFGYLHLKDVLYAVDGGRDEPVPSKRVRRLATVRAADEVEAVLATMQETGAHLARVVGEDGVVAGVVFLEDILEELIGTVVDAAQRS